MADLRRFLLGAFYSTSGSASDDKRYRWAWKPPDTIWDAIPIPDNAALPPFLSEQALNYYVDEYTRSDIESANNWYAAIQKSWENTSFLDGVVAQQPALFLGGERDSSLRPMYGHDRFGPEMEALKMIFRDVRVIMLPGVGHTPPEEKHDAVNAIVLQFLKDTGY